MVVFGVNRLLAILALGVQGLALALIFLVFGGPDLSLTQLLVEVLTVAILALVMARLDLTPRDPRPGPIALRDAILALAVGGGVTLLLLRVVAAPFNSRIGDFFAANSGALAHGRNIVNVILVDFRGLDTLGEITVIFAAAIAALALLRPHRKPYLAPADANEAPPQEVAP
jgi:multicomponent Na+:H+ antiporter subunit A